MKYEMPALTDEQREELIKHAEGMRNLSKADKTGSNDVIWLANEILLAALNAEPVKTKLKYSSVLPKFIGETDEIESVHCWVHGDTPEFATNEGAYAEAQKMIGDLYTAPPVPTLEPIGLPNADHETDDGYAFYRKESVISAIRAAGYEVKND